MGKPKADSSDQNQDSSKLPGENQAGAARANNSSMNKKAQHSSSKNVNPAKSPSSGFFISDDDSVMDELQLGWGLTDEQDELDAIISRTLEKPKSAETVSTKGSVGEAPVGEPHADEVPAAEVAAAEVSEVEVPLVAAQVEEPAHEIAEVKQPLVTPPPPKPLPVDSSPSQISPTPAISQTQVGENSRAALRKAQREASKIIESGSNPAQMPQPVEISPYAPSVLDSVLPSFLALDPPQEAPLEFTGFVTPSFDPNEYVPPPFQEEYEDDDYEYSSDEPAADTQEVQQDEYSYGIPAASEVAYDYSSPPAQEVIPSFLDLAVQPEVVSPHQVSKEVEIDSFIPMEVLEAIIETEQAKPKAPIAPPIPQTKIQKANAPHAAPTAKPTVPPIQKTAQSVSQNKPAVPIKQSVPATKPPQAALPPAKPPTKPPVAENKPAPEAPKEAPKQVAKEAPKEVQKEVQKEIPKPVEKAAEKQVEKPASASSEPPAVPKPEAKVKQKIEGPIVVDVNREASRDLQSETSTLISKFTPQQGLFGRIEQLAKDEQKIKDEQRAKEIADAAEAAAKSESEAKSEEAKPKSKLARTAAEEMAALLAEEEDEEKDHKIEAPNRTIKKTLLEDSSDRIQRVESTAKPLKKTLLEETNPIEEKETEAPPKAIKKTLLETDAEPKVAQQDASISRHRLNALEPTDDTPLTGLIKTIKSTTTQQDIARMSMDNQDSLGVEDEESLAEQAEVAVERREESVAIGNVDAIADVEAGIDEVESEIAAEIRKNLGANVELSVPLMPPPMSISEPANKSARDIKAEIRESVKAEGPEKKANILKALKQLEEQLDENDLDTLSTDSIKDVLSKLPSAKAHQADGSGGAGTADAARRAASKSRNRLQPAEEPTAEREIAREKLKVMQKMAHKLPTTKTYVVQKRAVIVVSAVVIVLTLAGVMTVRASTINARQALEKKDYQGALNSLGIALTLYPLSAEAHFLRGSALYLSKDLKGARTEYDTALKLNPGMRDALERRAAVNFQMGNNTEAIADYGKLLQDVGAQSHRFDQLQNVGVAYHRSGDLQHALDYYNRAIDKKANHVPALVGKASISFDRKQFEKTVFDCTKGLLAVPGNRDLLLLRARANTELNNFSSAQADIDILFKRSNSDSQAYASRAMLRLAQNKKEQAMTDLNKAVKLGPKDSSIYLDRSKVYVAMKNFDAAGKDLEKAHNLLGNKKTAQMAVAHAQFLSISNKRAEAVAELKEANAQFPQNVQIILSLADALAASGKLSEAIATTEKAIEQGKTTVDAQLKHGQLSLKFGNKMRATEDFAQVISLDPHNEIAFLERGKLFLLEEKYASAQEDFSKALSINPSNQEAKKNLDKARRLFASIVRVRPQANHQAGPSDAYLAGLAGKEFSTLLNDGFKAYQRGDNLTAVPTLEQAVKVNPRSAQARRYLAYAYKANEQSDDATLQFDALSPLGTLSSADILIYTELLIEHGAGAKAVTVLEEAITKNPGIQGYYFRLATAQQSSDVKAAVATCNKGIAINPRSSVGQQLIALRNQLLTGGPASSPNSQEEAKQENQS